MTKFNAAFWKWFGDSKVVDGKGQPVVMYHATAAEKDFTTFRRRPSDIGIHFGTLGQARDRMDYMASRRPGNWRIIPAYLSIQKPLRLEDSGSWNLQNLEYPLEQVFGKTITRAASSAGILFFDPKKKEFMLALRSDEVLDPGVWSMPGGACGEDGFFDSFVGANFTDQEIFDCAVRECREELGYFPEAYEVVDKVVYKKNKFTYTTFVLAIPPTERRAMDKEIELNWENDTYDWDTIPNWLAASDLHFGARHVLEAIFR